MNLLRLICLPAAVVGLTAGPLAAPAAAVPAGELTGTFVISSLAPVPGSLRTSGPVLHYSVLETSSNRGDVVSEGTTTYDCVQVADTIRCRGAGVYEGTVEGVAGTGTYATRVHLTCTTTLVCSGKVQVKGLTGALADLRGTGSAAAGAYSLHLTRV